MCRSRSSDTDAFIDNCMSPHVMYIESVLNESRDSSELYEMQGAVIRVCVLVTDSVLDGNCDVGRGTISGSAD